MQSIDSIETYAYGISKSLRIEKEKTKWLTLMMLQKKT